MLLHTATRLGVILSPNPAGEGFRLCAEISDEVLPPDVTDEVAVVFNVSLGEASPELLQCPVTIGDESLAGKNT